MENKKKDIIGYFLIIAILIIFWDDHVYKSWLFSIVEIFNSVIYNINELERIDL